jgi:hypothetical protein
MNGRTKDDRGWRRRQRPQDRRDVEIAAFIIAGAVAAVGGFALWALLR